MQEMTTDHRLRARWAQREVPLIDAIIFADGRIVIVRSATISDGTQIRTTVTRIADTSLASVLSARPDPWFEVEPLYTLPDPTNNICYRAGGGDMGNEGFVSAEILCSGHLLWVATFNQSNPFEALTLEGRVLKATNNLDEDWIFPLLDPTHIRIERPDWNRRKASSSASLQRS